MKKPTQDLIARELPQLSWQPSDAAASLSKLYDHVAGVGQEVVDWYYGAKRPKRRWGRSLRLGAILSTGVAAGIPLLAEIFEQEGGKPGIQPLWAAVALAAAGLMILLDRFWGCTSGWVRYLLAGQEASNALERFRLDWQSAIIAWGTQGPTAEQAQAMVALAKSFLVQVQGIVREETKGWAAEFQSMLQQIEEAAKHGRGTRTEPAPAGA